MEACFLLFQYALFGKCPIGAKKMTRPTFICGLDAALAVVGGKWKPLILFHLAHETRRYGNLRRAIGTVSDKVLVQQLKELEVDGIIVRVDFGEVPPKVEYSLTPFGQTLAEALKPLCAWGTQHMTEVERLVTAREVFELERIARSRTG
jgi:DNA-binding HxlR family transcriptional regulator